MTRFSIERGFAESESLGFRQTGASASEPVVLLFERELAAP